MFTHVVNMLDLGRDPLDGWIPIVVVVLARHAALFAELIAGDGGRGDRDLFRVRQLTAEQVGGRGNRAFLAQERERREVRESLFEEPDRRTTQTTRQHGAAEVVAASYATATA